MSRGQPHRIGAAGSAVFFWVGGRTSCQVLSCPRFDGKPAIWYVSRMKTTLDLPEELVHAVKLRAVMQRRTVKDLVAEYLRQGLGIAAPVQPLLPPGNSMIEIGPEGLPLVRCQLGAPASRMGAQELLQLEQTAQAEEDSRRAGIAV